MKLTYLGTAAAEGIPAIFCRCDVCRRASERGGRNIRTRSQALLDGRILIDFPPDTYWHTVRYGLDLTRISTLLITHVHTDHLYPGDLEMRNAGYAHLPENAPRLTVYGSSDVEPLISAYSRSDAEYPLSFSIRTVSPYQPFSPEEGYEVTALRAGHATPHPYNYLIRRADRALLYAHDTAFPSEEVFEYLKNNHVRLSLVSLDCTFAAAVRDVPSKKHMTFAENVQTRRRLLDDGTADEKTVFVLNHFSHNGGSVLYDDFAPFAAEHGFLTSYDGFEIEF